MTKVLSSDYAFSATLIDRPLSYGSPYFDKLFLTANIKQVGKNGIDIDLEGTSTFALNEMWRDRLGLSIPTAKDVHNKAVSGAMRISGGALVATKDGSNYILMRRDKGAPSYVGYITEPCGHAGEVPSQTINTELDEELFMVGLVGGEFRVLSFVGRQKEPASQALINRQIGVIAEKLHDQNINPDCLLGRDPVPVPVRWPKEDWKKAKQITVRVGARVIEEFRALALLNYGDNALELRRSMVSDLTLEDIRAGKVRFFDAENYGRTVEVIGRDALKHDLCPPFTRHYLDNNLR